MTYPITEIFRTLQGEGRFVGYPAVFVRLAGCSLWGRKECHLADECDTEPTRVREHLEAEDVLARVEALAQPGGIVVITGGEPTDYDLLPLFRVMGRAGHRLHLETSGKHDIDLARGWLECLTVSPKNPNYRQRIGDVLKVVVRPNWSWVEIEELDRSTTFYSRYLQPLTGTDGQPMNLAHVMNLLQDACNREARWALSSQAHRYWKVP